MVPELTRSIDVQVNERVSLWQCQQPLSFDPSCSGRLTPKSAACDPTARQGPSAFKPRRRLRLPKVSPLSFVLSVRENEWSAF
jgi:hypothetical protein